MVTRDEILARIPSDKKEAPIGAFATELQSNADIVGNKNSQHMYNQTPEKDDGMQKMANNRYLEKIATSFPVGPYKSWGRRLYENIAHAEPLTQLGLGAGTVFSLTRLGNMIGEARQRQTNKHNAETSLKVLQNVNRNLKGLKSNV